MEMALQFHIDVALAEYVDQVFHRTPRFFQAATGQRGGQRAVIAPGQADQPGCVFLQLILADRAFAFLRPQFHFCNQAAEVLVAGAGKDEEGEAEFTTETRRHGGIQGRRPRLDYV